MDVIAGLVAGLVADGICGRCYLLHRKVVPATEINRFCTQCMPFYGSLFKRQKLPSGIATWMDGSKRGVRFLGYYGLGYYGIAEIHELAMILPEYLAQLRTIGPQALRSLKAAVEKWHKTQLPSMADLPFEEQWVAAA